MWDRNKLQLLELWVPNCLRQEVGSLDWNNRGIIKVHQFENVEQFITVLQDNERKDDAAYNEPTIQDADKAEDVDKGGGDKKKNKLIKKKYSEKEEMYKTRPIWIKSPDDISNEEFGKFYKSVAKETKNNVKLYVSRVFFMANCEDLIPEYFDIIEGLVDSEDPTLNIFGAEQDP